MAGFLDFLQLARGANAGIQPPMAAPGGPAGFSPPTGGLGGMNSAAGLSGLQALSQQLSQPQGQFVDLGGGYRAWIAKPRGQQFADALSAFGGAASQTTLEQQIEEAKAARATEAAAAGEQAKSRREKETMVAQAAIADKQAAAQADRAAGLARQKHLQQMELEDLRAELKPPKAEKEDVFSTLTPAEQRGVAEEAARRFGAGASTAPARWQLEMLAKELRAGGTFGARMSVDRYFPGAVGMSDLK